MRYHTLEFKLLKSFINSEFCFQQKKIKHLEFYKQSINTYVYKKDALTILDPFIHFKTIKQFIRLLQFIKKTNYPLLYILVKNTQINFLIYEFIKQNYYSLFPVDVVLDSDLLTDIAISKVVLLLNCFFFEQSELFSKSNKNYNLIFKINSLNESLYYNQYKILNDVENIKKLIFLLVLIKKNYTIKKFK